MKILLTIALFAVFSYSYPFNFSSLARGPSAGGGGGVLAVSTNVDIVDIEVGDRFQTAIDANPAGTTFIVKAGTHYNQGDIRPKDGDTFIGELGGYGEKLSIVSGAILLSSFTRETIGNMNYWVAAGQTQEGREFGECDSDHPRCTHPEELFIDDVRLLHVAAISGLTTSDQWFFDYPADKIYFLQDPTGKKVETSVQQLGFNATTPDNSSVSNYVTIRDLIVEKYATPAQKGAIMASHLAGIQLANGWSVLNNEVRFNHGVGINIGLNYITTPPRSRIVGTQCRGNYVHHNGQLGIGGSGDDAVVDGNEIAYNNGAGFSPGFEAGGTKFSTTRNLTVSNNYVHDNAGPGLWTDESNIYTVYEYNRSEFNTGEGIVHEVSYDAVIRYNYVAGNGANDRAGWLWGSGIGVHASPNVEVYGNIVVNNQNGISGIQQNRDCCSLGWYGSLVLQNLYVHDNIVYQNVNNTVGGLQVAAGIVQDVTADNSTSATFTSRNNHFNGNTYFLLSGQNGFAWKGRVRNETYWKGEGQDFPTGLFNRGTNTAPTFATYKSTIGSPAPSISAKPNPMSVCDGTGLGATTISWSAPGTPNTEVHVNSPTGFLFAAGVSSGNQVTDKWVTDGMIFYLVAASSGVTLGTVTVGITTSGCSSRPPIDWTSNLSYIDGLGKALNNCITTSGFTYDGAGNQTVDRPRTAPRGITNVTAQAGWSR